MIAIALFVFLAQAPQQPPVPPPSTTSSLATAEDYLIGVQDVVNVTVFGEPDASRTGVTVDTDGTIDCPLIGRVKIAGLSARSAEKEIHDRLAKGFLVSPSVGVEVVKFRSKSVIVQGQVRAPAEYTLAGNASLTSVLAQAGSMTLDAASYVIISRKGANGATEQFRVTRKDIESGRAQSVLLKDGDTVLVPKADTFFVNGQVRSPGSYTWDEGLTVERALVFAGGLTERAGRIDIERGKTTIKKVKKTDLVQANNTIRVGTRIF